MTGIHQDTASPLHSLASSENLKIDDHLITFRVSQAPTLCYCLSNYVVTEGRFPWLASQAYLVY